MTVNIEDRIRDAVDAWGAGVDASPEAWTAIHHRVKAPKRTRLRRLGIWGASIGLVAAVGIPVEQALVAASDHGTRVSVVRPPGPNLPNPSDRKPNVVDGTAPGPLASPDGSTGTAPATAEAVASSGATPSGTDAAGAAAYPPGPACSLDTTGLSPGASSTCRFTATNAGGWSAGYVRQDQTSPPIGVAFADPFADVQVTRAGVTTHYMSGQYGAGCGDAVIEPGDLVEVTLTAAPPTTAPTPPGHYEVGAGYHWDCGQHG